MAQLLVRNLPDQVVTALRKRAAANGRSVEAEHRAVLESALHEDHDKFWVEAARMRALTEDRSHAQAEEVVRAYRDRR